MRNIEDRRGFDSGLTIDEDDGIYTIGFGAEGDSETGPVDLLDDILRALDYVESSRATGAVVIEIANGSLDFDSGGMDISRLSPAMAEVFSLKCSLIYRRLDGLQRPLIASVSGDCFGLALEIALHCDLRIANTSARFGLTGMNFGLTPNAAAVGRLIRLIGESHARMMSLTGAMISAERAFVMGFVTNVLDEKDFNAGVSVLSRHLAAMSPIAIAETKKILVIANQDQPVGIADVSAKALLRCIEEGNDSRSIESPGHSTVDATIH